MTAKGKAKEMVVKFMKIDSDSEMFDGFKMGLFYAKRCALIAVDEIIKDLKESLKVAEDLHLHARGLIIGSLVDWQEVKQEIEKL